MKSLLFVCVSFWVLLGLQSVAFSVTISGVSGTLSNGQSVVIVGSGFGTKAAAAPLISSYDSAVSANNWSTGTRGSNWYTQGSPVLSAANKRTSLTQSSYGMAYDAADAYDVIGYNHAARSDASYISWWVYRDYSTWDGIYPGNAKFMRLYTSSTNGAGNGPVYSTEWSSDGSARYTYTVPEYAPLCAGWSIAYTGTGATLSASAYFKVLHGAGNAGLNSWEHYELYNIFSANLEGGDDTSILLKNGETVYRAINVSLQKSNSDDDQRNLRLGQVSGGRTVSGKMEYIDQIYYDNTIAHVFLSESSTTTWPDVANPTHTETQVCSNWSDSSVTCTLNQGSFGFGQTVYVYVVDSYGAVNSSGFPLTIGGESTIVQPAQNLLVEPPQ